MLSRVTLELVRARGSSRRHGADRARRAGDPLEVRRRGHEPRPSRAPVFSGQSRSSLPGVGRGPLSPTPLLRRGRACSICLVDAARDGRAWRIGSCKHRCLRDADPAAFSATRRWHPTGSRPAARAVRPGHRAHTTSRRCGSIALPISTPRARCGRASRTGGRIRATDHRDDPTRGGSGQLGPPAAR